MKKIFFVLATVLAGGLMNVSYAQNAVEPKSTTQALANGVVIHEAVGVEGVVTETTETPVVANAVENWNADQIREAMEYIKLKSAENCSVKEYASYEQQLKELQEKLNQLEPKK